MVKYGRLSPRITVGNRLRIELDEREPTCPTNRSSVRPTDHPSNRESVRPTVRPVLLRRKANIVLSATTSTLFIATTKETTKEVARPKAAPPLLWWRPKAATFVVAMNRVDVVALNTIFVLRLSKTGRTVGRTDSRVNGWSVGRTHGCLFCEGPAGGVDFGKLRFMIF